MASKVSGIVLTHNSERTIMRCLTSLIWCDEICILDDYSTDDTLGIAAKFPTRIFQRKLRDNFSQQRNYAISVAKNEWIFFVDADEIVSDKLAEEIESAIVIPAYNGYKVPRIDIRDGKRMRYGEFSHFQIVRLAKKGSGEWIGDIHETWDVSGNIGKLCSPLLHYQTGGIQSFISKMNYYSTLRAHELYVKKKKSGLFSILFFPPVKFFVNYILKLGFLDGIPGVINAIGMSFYTFLVRGKLWLLWNETTKKA